jgi:hypothetical protein
VWRFGAVHQLLRSLAPRDLLFALAVESGFITIPCGHYRLLFVWVKDKPLDDQDPPCGDGNGTASPCTLPSGAADDRKIARLAQVKSPE